MLHNIIIIFHYIRYYARALLRDNKTFVLKHTDRTIRLRRLEQR